MALLNAAAIWFWSSGDFYLGYLLLYSVLFVLMSVCTYAIAMGQSQGSVAATQFSIFMALLNFGTSLGAGQLGWVRASGGYPAAFAACAALSLLAIGFYAVSVAFNQRLEHSTLLRDQEMRL